MENKVNKHSLVEFAERRLKEHIAELNTRYQGRQMASEEEKKKAIETHLNMFKSELREKNKELGDEQEGNNIIKGYEEKFKKELP